MFVSLYHSNYFSDYCLKSIAFMPLFSAHRQLLHYKGAAMQSDVTAKIVMAFE